MRIETYTAASKSTWDAFVETSRSGTFLHKRDYVEYHGDRYGDHSLLVADNRGRTIALLAAFRKDDLVSSHGGLTYGGFITGLEMKLPVYLEMFDAVLTVLQQQGIRRLEYKPVPHIYHRVPAEEDLYALFLCNASLVSRNVLAVVDARRKIPFQERRKRSVKKASTAQVTAQESQDLEGFWAVLTDVLRQTYDASPVHSLKEISGLIRCFPENIRLYTCTADNRVLAGVVVYESDLVARAQYIAASADGRNLGALDRLFAYLLEGPYRDKPYFSFGSSNEDLGRYLNRSLMDHKEGFGARAVMLDTYAVDVDAYVPGQLLKAMTKTTEGHEAPPGP